MNIHFQESPILGTMPNVNTTNSLGEKFFALMHMIKVLYEPRVTSTW